jgi:membrane protein
MLAARLARFFHFFRYLNWITLKKTVARAMKRRLMGLSSEVAYNAMLALFPAILVILTAIGLFADTLHIPLRNLVEQFTDVAPEQALQLIRDFASEISRRKNRGLFSLSFVLAIWVSSGALSAAMNALDQIHQIPREQTRPFWKAKLISLALTIGSIILLFTASFLVFISELVLKLAVDFIDRNGASILLTAWRLLSWPLALSIVATAFAFIYRFGPSRWKPGTPIVPGAVLAAVSWAVVSGLFRLYVANFGNYNKVYGAVGAVIVLLLWLYMTSLVLLLGDQLNVIVGEQMRQDRRKGQSRALDTSPAEESKAR